MRPSKLPHKWSILMLCTLVSCVYLLRNSAPELTARSLQAAAPAQSTMCVGVNTTESFSQSQIDRFNSIDNYLSNVRGGNQLLNDLNSDSITSWDQFLHTYLHSLLPFIVVGLVLAFLSLVCLYTHCCDYACFRICSNPTKINKILCMGTAVVFSLTMVGLASAGLYYSGGMSTGYQKGTCSVSNFMVEFSAGNSTANWIGLAPAVNSIQNVTSSISSTINGLPNPDETHTNMTNNYTSLVTAINTYYTNSENQTVANPLDPNSTAVAIVPDFIANLGPTNNTNSLSGAILNEATNKYQLINDTLNALGSVISSLKQNSASISSALQDGVGLAGSLNTKVNAILSDYESYAGTGKTANNIVSISLMIFFIIAIVLSVIIVLGVLNTFTKKFRWVYRLMVITRYFLNIILFLSALVLAIAWPVSVMTMETCNGLNQLITDKNVFNEFFPNGSIIGLVNTCFYGNGNVLGALGIQQVLATISSVFDGKQTLVQYMSMPDSVVIPGQQESIALYQSGQAPVTQDIVTDLSTLNNYTEAPSSCSQDTWVLNSINCTSSMGAEFDPSGGVQDNYGNPTCIGVNQFIASGYNGSLRYNSSSCSNHDAGLLVYGFEKHLKQVNTVFSTLQTDLANVSTINSAFMYNVRNVVTPFAQIGDTINNILQTVGNNQTGLVANMNCGFIGTNTQTVVNDVCIGYLPIIFDTCVYLLVFTIITLLALTPVFFAGKIQMKMLESEDGNMGDNFDTKYLIIEETSPEGRTVL